MMNSKLNSLTAKNKSSSLCTECGGYCELGPELKKNVKAKFCMQIFVNCPECNVLINIIDPKSEKDNGSGLYGLDEIKNQIHQEGAPYETFKVDWVTCGKCDFDFDVIGIEL